MRLPRLSSAFPTRFVSFVSLVSLCQLVHQKGEMFGEHLLFPKWSLDYALSLTFRLPADPQAC